MRIKAHGRRGPACELHFLDENEKALDAPSTYARAWEPLRISHIPRALNEIRNATLHFFFFGLRNGNANLTTIRKLLI